MSATAEKEYKVLFEKYILNRSEVIPVIAIPIEKSNGSSDGNKPNFDEQDSV